MGNFVSSLGFNQPFLLALLGLSVFLGVTYAVVARVGGEEDDEQELLRYLRSKPFACPLPPLPQQLPFTSSSESAYAGRECDLQRKSV
uniref:Uncharacterized protein n=1 Tax=Plectus sambesii TaxID=2011161 RepID=A0A914VL56_9BILA